jgi:hypothetical protein
MSASISLPAPNQYELGPLAGPIPKRAYLRRPPFTRESIHCRPPFLRKSTLCGLDNLLLVPFQRESTNWQPTFLRKTAIDNSIPASMPYTVNSTPSGPSLPRKLPLLVDLVTRTPQRVKSLRSPLLRESTNCRPSFIRKSTHCRPRVNPQSASIHWRS